AVASPDVQESVDKSGRVAVFRLGRDARRLCSKEQKRRLSVRSSEMTQTDITTASVVAYNDAILHDEVDREVVALSTVSGACYGLNAVGSRIWHLMANPVRVGDLCAV